jgi:hypothetical protein
MSQPAAWLIENFVSAHGQRPVDEWLLALEKKERARVRRALGLLRDYGTQLGMPYAAFARQAV